MTFLALATIFSVLFFNSHNYFYLLLIVFSLFISFKRNTKSTFIVSCLILFVFSLVRFNYFVPKVIGSTNNQFVVVEDNSNYVVLENDDIKVIFYDHNELSKGNRVSIEGEFIKIEDDSDFNKYLIKQRIYYCLDGEVVLNDNDLSIDTKIINWLLRNKDEENSKILKLILFNIKDDSNIDFYELFDNFSLSFLVVISGFHINLLFKVLNKLGVVKYLFICFYLVLLGLSVSGLKAFIYYVLKKVNKKFNLSFNNMDLLSLILVSLLFVNPSYCFNLGFIYTFVFSFSIDLINNTMVSKNKKNKFIVRTIIFLVSVPLILLSKYEINLASLIMTLAFEWPISILFVFSLLYLFFDKFYLLYKVYVLILQFALNFVDGISINLVFGKPLIIIVFLLYLSIFAFLYFYQSKRKILSVICLLGYFIVLSFQYCLPLIDSREMVYFIDVGQGDCIAFKIPYSKDVVLVDTGGNKTRDIATKDIIPFLKEKGINNIDKVIITHDDFDHNGGLISLKENFSVKEVINTSDIDFIVIGNKRFMNLNKSNNRDNDSSIVLYGEWGGLNYLLTGDISSEVEEKIVENYFISVDILKVSHHGSNDSTSEMFINAIKPKVALIGVGKNNRYNHPGKKTLDILEDNQVKVYRSDMCGNIVIYKSIFTNSIIIEKEKDVL